MQLLSAAKNANEASSLPGILINGVEALSTYKDYLSLQENLFLMLRKKTARIRFYSIKECGYYSRAKGGKEGSWEFGGVERILSDLESWIEGKKLNETSTYGDAEDSMYSTYCNGVQSNDFGDYFITTWNKTAESSKPIASIDGDGLVGKADVNLTKILNGYVPGFSTYFWIIPSLNKIATIQFSEKKQGLVELRPYLKRFMENFSSYCVKKSAKEEGGEIIVEILGYSNTRPEFPRKLTARFRTEFYEDINRNLDFIREKRIKIKKILRRTSLSREMNEQATLLGNIFSFTGHTDLKKESQKVRFDYAIELPSPSKEELDQIISSWKKKVNDLDNMQEKLGFSVTGEEKDIWVDSSYFSRQFELKVSQENDKFISLDSLNDSISSIRQSILEDMGVLSHS